MKITTDNKPSFHSMLYEANIVISLDHKNDINILKDRYSGEVDKNLSKTEVIEMLSRILSLYIFKGRMVMFQEAMKEQLVKQITDVIQGSNIIPKGDFENENPIQRKSRRNGFGNNKLRKRII